MKPSGDDAPVQPSPEPSTQEFPAGIGAADSLPGPGSAPSTLPSETPAATTVLPRPNIPGYDILSELGRGGMGVVYQARHLGLKRLVALKMILAGSAAGAEMLRRFKQEAEIIAELDHAHIVQVYDCGEWEGKPYISLEYVPGPSLDRFQQGKPLPPRTAAELLLVLAETMRVVHGKGIVHRDLKPSNILLKPKAESGNSKSTKEKSSAVGQDLAAFIPKITDFGLAKKLDTAGGHTKTGAVLGSPNYMAPEQVEGRIREISPATDIFALGGILYELLIGEPPFVGDSLFAIMNKIMSVEPVPPRQRQPAVPEDLEYICLKALQKRPEQRYPSGLELTEDLRKFLAGERVNPQRPETVTRQTLQESKEVQRRQPGWSGAKIAILVLVVLLLVAGLLLPVLLKSDEKPNRETVAANDVTLAAAGKPRDTNTTPQRPANGLDTGSRPLPDDPDKEQRKKVAVLEQKFREQEATTQESEFRRLGQELTAINNEYLPAELLGRKAEYYVETAEGRNSRNVSEARTCLDLARSRGAGVTQEGWYHYVEARLLYKQNQGNTAAIALARTDNKYITGFRTKKALEVYDRAAKDWTATLKIDATALGQEPTSGPIWMPQAAALSATARDAKLSPDMLLLFTWTSPTPKPEHLDQLLDTADAKEIARRDDGALALAELHRRRAET